MGLWATHQLLPPTAHGEFARQLAKSRGAALKLAEKIKSSELFTLIVQPETDIVVWAFRGSSIVEINKKAQQLFDTAASNNLHLSLLKLPADKLDNQEINKNSNFVTCLRSVLMKPEHDDWIEDIWSLLLKSVA